VPKRNIFSMNFRYNKDELVKQSREFEKEFKRGLLRELGREIGAKEEMIDKLNVTAFLEKGVGNQVGLHVYDSVPNFDFNMPEVLGQMMGTFNNQRWGGGRDIEGMFVGFMLTGLNSPVYLSIPVQDAKVVDEFGDQLELIMAMAARRGLRGGFFE